MQVTSESVVNAGAPFYIRLFFTTWTKLFVFLYVFFFIIPVDSRSCFVLSSILGWAFALRHIYIYIYAVTTFNPTDP